MKAYWTARAKKPGWRTATAAVGILLLAPVLAAAPAAASPDGDDVVINEIYTRGGSSGEPFDHKFVELYNPTDGEIDLNDWSLQYRSSANNPGQKINLSGTIPSNGYFLVEGGQNGGSNPAGDALPAPDQSSSSFQIAGDNGILLLASTTSVVNPPDGDVGESAEVEDLIDLVGYGTAAAFETAASAAPPKFGSIERTDGVDTDNNDEDFASLEFPTPTNSEGETVEPPGPPECDHVPEGRVEIAEVQGTGDETPFLECDVTTAGVVTAVYPTGGFNGAYIQTPGTGGEIDLAAHTASDGIFVYGSQFAAAVDIGDYVEVTGEATEYFGLTQVALPEWNVLEEEYDPVEPALITWPETDEERELFEGMLIDPQGDYTVTNLHQTEMYGEIGLAFGDSPLLQPTEYALPLSDDALAIEADNAAREVSLDDGSSWNYINFNQTYHETPIPYLSHDTPVRVGAAVTFEEPVILDWRNDTWKFQPTGQAVGDLEGYEKLQGQISAPVTFENTREAAPDVGGNLSIGAFNVLNYFTDLGIDEEGCGFYTDRAGEPSSADWCDVRGAYSQDNLDRQTAKIVAAITELDADILALQEVENTLEFPNGENAPEGLHPRDVALAQLVDELNAVAGEGVWDYAPSPEDVPDEEDVIRNAFIYQTDAAALVGESEILLDSEDFHNAREPLAQEFAPLDDDGNLDEDAETILLVTTHLKSKGSGTDENADQGDGQAASNPDRIRQATAMAEYIDELVDSGMSENVFILGDLNSYTMEDPMQVLYESGYTDIGATMTDEKTYSFDGMIGSLDHVLANEAGMSLVVDADVWSVNAYESVGLEYSRFNYNVVPLFQESPYRSSDHDPLVVGLDLAAEAPDPEVPDPTEPGPTEPEPDPTETEPTDPGEGGGDADDDRLEDTGVNMAPLIALGGVLLAVGAGLIIRRNRMA